MSKQRPTFLNLPKQRPDESKESWYKHVRDWIAGEDVRVKTDLKDWTGSPKFHLNREKE